MKKRNQHPLQRIITVIVFTIFVILTSGLYLGCSENKSVFSKPDNNIHDNENKTQNGLSEQPIAVRVRLPEYRTIKKSIPYVGTVYATTEIPIVTRVQGTLVELPYHEGEAFQKGAVLVRLDSPEIEASVNRLWAEVEYWSSHYATDLKLAKEKAIPDDQVKSSERALRTAQASLDEAEAQLSKTVISAPFDGTVLDWTAEIGQPLMPGQPLILIGDSKREIRIDVIEEDLRRGIETGTTAEFTLAADSIIRSHVFSIAPASSNASRTFTAIIPIPNGIEPLPRKGSSLRTDFVTAEKRNSLVVPSRAISDPDHDPYIFYVKNGIAHKVDINPGISENGWTTVDFPWDNESPIATTSLGLLYDGAPVYSVSTGGDE